METIAFIIAFFILIIVIGIIIKIIRRILNTIINKGVELFFKPFKWIWRKIKGLDD